MDHDDSQGKMKLGQEYYSLQEINTSNEEYYLNMYLRNPGTPRKFPQGGDLKQESNPGPVQVH